MGQSHIEKIWYIIGGRKFLAVVLSFIALLLNHLEDWCFMVIVLAYMGINVYKYIEEKKTKAGG